jgi:hypothetical protein
MSRPEKSLQFGAVNTICSLQLVFHPFKGLHYHFM